MDDYWTGPGGLRRDQVYAVDLSTTVRANAMRWVAVANDLADRLGLLGIALSTSPKTGTPLASGWRPPSVNAITVGASKTSLHMTGQAGDLYDPDGKIDDYLMDHQDLMAEFGVWLEHPDDTPTWSHWQIVPPGSGNRVFRAK
jgi:hypothetical protein